MRTQMPSTIAAAATFLSGLNVAPRAATRRHQHLTTGCANAHNMRHIPVAAPKAILMSYQLADVLRGTAPRPSGRPGKR